MSLLKGPFFIKLIALLLAIPAYFYITHEIQQAEKKNISDPSYKLLKLTAMKVAVKVRLSETSPENHEVIQEAVTVNPVEIVVIGPEAMLESDSAQIAETSIVDISESTKTIQKKVSIESVAGIHLAGKLPMVDVTVPVRKKELPEATVIS